MPQPAPDPTERRPLWDLNPRQLWAWWLGIVLSIALLLFTYHHLAILASGGRQPAIKALIDELTAAFGAGLLFWPIRAFVHRLPLEGAARWRRLPLYPAVLLAISLVHTSLNWASRSLLYPLAGQGRYDYGEMPLRYFMELPADTIGFVIMVVAIHVARRLRRSRQRELEAERLSRRLTEARLESLRLQLQPHFLFNSLNTISAAMYRDVEAADEMIQRLGDLLRLSLRRGEADEVSLAQEVEVLEDYLALMKARFGERLEVGVQIDEAAQAVRVPSLLLQPLVENAIRHGALESVGSARVRVRAELIGEAEIGDGEGGGTQASSVHREGQPSGGILEIEVWDDGPGPPPGVDPLGSGLGLSATAERLRLLYGPGQSLSAETGEGGGFTIRIRIPLERDEAA